MSLEVDRPVSVPCVMASSAQLTARCGIVAVVVTTNVRSCAARGLACAATRSTVRSDPVIATAAAGRTAPSSRTSAGWGMRLASSCVRNVIGWTLLSVTAFH